MNAVCARPPGLAQPSLRTLLAAWQRILGRRCVNADDDFFDLGGDSMLAIQLFAEIERLTGHDLPIITIYDAPTPSLLLEVLHDMTAPRPFSPLVPLSTAAPGAQLPSLFLIHGVGGNVMELKQLGRALETRARVIGVQARGLDGIEPPFERIEDMAACYLDAVRAMQPQGPYQLVGYSFGGLVALEMARRIEAAGERIGLLAFIDSYPHPSRWPLRVWLDVRLRRIAHRARAEARARWARWSGRADAGATGVGRADAGPRRPTAARPFPTDGAWPAAVQATYDAAVRALSRYDLSRYAGPVIFYRAAERSFYLPSRPWPIWRSVLDRMDVVTIPGNHVVMIGAGAETLAAHLAAHLAAPPAGDSGLPVAARVPALA